MDFIILIILAIIQGVTEFIPVSSSGHLVLIQHLTNHDISGISTEIFLHIATLLSICVFFQKDIIKLLTKSKEEINQGWRTYIVVSTLITGILGFLLKPWIEPLFSNHIVVYGALFLTGILLYSTKFTKHLKNRPITMNDAIFFGLIQTVALTPGISRSGITIAFLLWRGVRPDLAFSYSFLAVTPLLVALGFYEFLYAGNSITLSFELFTAVFIAFAVGTLSLMILKKVTISKVFHRFSYYCFIISIIGYTYLFLLN